jgi:hypothetical protein
MVYPAPSTWQKVHTLAGAVPALGISPLPQDAPVLATDPHPFEKPPLRVNNPFGPLGLSS